MKLTTRQSSLIRRILSKHSLSVEDLLTEFPVSRETLRKDLLVLERLDLVKRSYGEVAFVENEANEEFLRNLGWLTKSQRQERVVGLLRDQREVRISMLAKRLNVTAATIRSDLDELEQAGVVIKKHGAAALNTPTIPLVVSEETVEYPLKTRILGQRGLFHINPNEQIFLDDSPFNQFIASRLPFYLNIPIVTNCLAIAELLRKRRYTSEILLLPGALIPGTGVIALRGARSFFALTTLNKAFLSPRSFSNRHYYFDTQAEVDSLIEICEQVEKLYLFLDSASIDKKGEFSFPYKQFEDKVQEILIDDGLRREEAALLFTKKDPVAICGLDFSYLNLKQRKYRIGFLANRDKNYFIQAVYNSLQEAVGRYPSTSLVIRETEGIYREVLANTDLLLGEGIDLLIDYSLCFGSALQVSDRCRSHSVKLISVDVPSLGAAYYGADNALAGRMAGERAAEYLQTNWGNRLDRIILLGKFDVDHGTNQRISSTVEAVKASVGGQLLETLVIEWGNPSVNPTVELIRVLKSLPIDEKVLFVGFTIHQLLGAHDLIAQHRSCEHTIMVGQNYTRQIDEIMKVPNTPLIGCVHYNPEGYGDQVMDLAMKLLENHPVPDVSHTLHTWIPNPYREIT